LLLGGSYDLLDVDCAAGDVEGSGYKHGFPFIFLADFTSSRKYELFILESSRTYLPLILVIFPVKVSDEHKQEGLRHHRGKPRAQERRKKHTQKAQRMRQTD
jgi:hypothetical protein